MNDEELFKAYVKHRREMHSWKQFWLILIPVIAALIVYTYFIIHYVIQGTS